MTGEAFAYLTLPADEITPDDQLPIACVSSLSGKTFDRYFAAHDSDHVAVDRRWVEGDVTTLKVELVSVRQKDGRPADRGVFSLVLPSDYLVPVRRDLTGARTAWTR